MAVSLSARRAIVDVCHRLYDRGLIAGGEGNVSVRLGPDHLLVTPAGVSKGELRPAELLEVGDDGRLLRGEGAPSTEIGMHLRIYRRRGDVRAVVHAHPPTATGFAVAGEGLASDVIPELIFQVGTVALVPYGMPGTDALADRLEPFLAGHEAFLLANHGATTVGQSLRLAHQRMESLEQSARILLTARLLGRVTPLDPADVQALLAARRREVRAVASGDVESR